MMAMDASKRAIIFEIPIIPPLPKKLMIRSALMNEIHTMKKLRIRDMMVGMIP
jgi:predicted phosphatase